MQRAILIIMIPLWAISPIMINSDNRHVLMAKLILQFHDKGVLDTVLPIDAI